MSRRHTPTSGTDDGLNPTALNVTGVLHRGRLIAFGVAVIALIAGAFWAGTLVITPEDSALSQAPEHVPVTVRAEQRTVGDVVRLPGAIAPAVTAEIHAAAAGEGGQPVVSRRVLSPGDEVRPGILLAEVSGAPVFAVPAAMPVYRDITQGISGTDVRELQKVLVGRGLRPGTVNGQATPATMAAVDRLFTRAGYTAPRDADDHPVLKSGGLIRIPVASAPVTVAAAQGTPLGADTALLTVQTAPATLTVKASDAEAKRIPAGATVQVRSGTQNPVSTGVLGVGDLVAGEAGGPATRTVTMTLPAGAGADGAPIEVASAEAPQPTLAVPLVAIRHDGTDTYVVPATPPAKDKATAASPTHIPITIVTQSGGWAAIADAEGIAEGTELAVSP